MAQPASKLTALVEDLCNLFGQPVIDPLDKSAPPGTLGRRVHAYNALRTLAKPGRDRYCASEDTDDGTLCVLTELHPDNRFNTSGNPHMTVADRDRARRYLVHSEPDPERRA